MGRPDGRRHSLRRAALPVHVPPRLAEGSHAVRHGRAGRARRARHADLLRVGVGGARAGERELHRGAAGGRTGRDPADRAAQSEDGR